MIKLIVTIRVNKSIRLILLAFLVTALRGLDQ